MTNNIFAAESIKSKLIKLVRDSTILSHNRDSYISAI